MRFSASACRDRFAMSPSVLATVALNAMLHERTAASGIVAVDVPVGLCADSGRTAGATAMADAADLTVTFHSAEGRALSWRRAESLRQGRVVRHRTCARGNRHAVATIRGMTERRTCRKPARVEPVSGRASANERAPDTNTPTATPSSSPAPPVAAGRRGWRRGGRLRIGAGVVTVGCPPEAMPENAARLDAVMLRGVADGGGLGRGAGGSADQCAVSWAGDGVGRAGGGVGGGGVGESGRAPTYGRVGRGCPGDRCPRRRCADDPVAGRPTCSPPCMRAAC